MTTITKEHAQKIIDAADDVITALAGTNDDFHPDNSEKMCGLWDDLNDRYAPPEVVRELARAMLASMDAEPAGYHVIKECGKVGCSVATLEEAEKTRDFWNKKWTIRPYFYSAQPVQETGVYNDVLNIIGLLENNEWAEHCASTVLGSLLESEITRLVGKEKSVPVVPEEMPKGLAGQIVSLLAHNIGDKFLAQKIWNACRAALLNGDIFRENSISSTNNFREIAETSTNSPVIPGGWISCSERMPEDEQEVIVHNKLGYRYVSYFDEHSGLFFDMRGGNQMNCIEHLLVTHWRPMPAPPQQ
ncbi:DUF551 domain-containing protein [Salmonella enterica]|nr:DUF551 domain-containing protein [Salmonella enterica]MCG3551147.1 DUF551 domain-containing protein [Salmonella enterica subsp. diarizonae]MDJ3482836.1 DUF551 domain-containing protein [Salmonella enterica]QMW51490.1 DUF551 domain-containing protein [Salmonella enterica subsp. diarizonae serovar b,50:-:-]UAM83528.1 DUF551 domain-containing protein [Salmonella enterica subsp. arizonae]WKN76243.1 DUF551 domain-containing protein [Salmonella enterica subsp. diarizonae]